MTNRKVGTLVLQGQESVDCVNSLLRPTEDERQHFRDVFNRINKNIDVCDSKNGFVAYVADLDLYFLDDK